MEVKNALNRRDFLITLGAGTSLAISGFFMFKTIKNIVNEQHPDEPSDKPVLSEQISITYQDKQMILSGEKAKCFVNKTGEKIVGLLDGRNTLPHIAAQISDYYAIEHTGSLEAAVASFICQLGAQGFLYSPYYVTIYETN